MVWFCSLPPAVLVLVLLKTILLLLYLPRVCRRPITLTAIKKQLIRNNRYDEEGEGLKPNRRTNEWVVKLIDDFEGVFCLLSQTMTTKAINQLMMISGVVGIK